jgi:hypothetical protein
MRSASSAKRSRCRARSTRPLAAQLDAEEDVVEDREVGASANSCSMIPMP